MKKVILATFVFILGFNFAQAMNVNFKTDFNSLVFSLPEDPDPPQVGDVWEVKGKLIRLFGHKVMCLGKKLDCYIIEVVAVEPQLKMELTTFNEDGTIEFNGFISDFTQTVIPDEDKTILEYTKFQE